MRSNGRPFEERQHILRIKGNGPFQILILPYRKGQKRSDLQVKQDGTKVIIESKGENMILADNFYAYRNGHKRVLATLTTGRLKPTVSAAPEGPWRLFLNHTGLPLRPMTRKECEK